MPTLTKRKPKSKPHATRAGAKSAAKRGPSFGEWVRKYAGIVKNAPADLSMREGFGD